MKLSCHNLYPPSAPEAFITSSSFENRSPIPEEEGGGGGVFSKKKMGSYFVTYIGDPYFSVIRLDLFTDFLRSAKKMK